MKPGEIIVKRTEIEVNRGHNATILDVKNTGDRPIQVGSHYHFFEANPALQFEREKAYGKRLDIPAGAAVRFEPGDEKEVQLVEYSGKRRIFGFHGEVNGPIDEARVYKAEDDDSATEIIAEENKVSENANKESGYNR
ncbi:urease subunit beta [Staphylococcus xylosus]|uniref:Urease subunit beta n=2 Tax=Staphylococcus xylosus TaxID=1288 RepID=URE2_STAXY|nr:urease subunit beta [Staphylococcus xylosus]P42874.1 RecName: Full=Urease subunit beta; AltName: Full=Urea amidohydrolase subunit beta [Staphylococcus xylosus]AID41723.1 Urease beta subunit [Staphylococcus xylosus]MBE6180127.1 urease subunit beta [Staphylococcus xylosus]MBM6639130.1 urease subunit beta [Staphylococcus xylosus]MCE7782523.1 urease subunit beta [Staphylococcus xylosus]MDO5513630.1 urease subunit beta [Staphylococcus xylosus]